MTNLEYVLNFCKWEFKNDLADLVKGSERDLVLDRQIESACSPLSYDSALTSFFAIKKRLKK